MKSKFILPLLLIPFLLNGCANQGPVGPQGEQGIQGPKGEKGDSGADGKSILSITKTSSVGNIDTYTITYSDNTSSTFTVSNGKDGASLLTGNGFPSSSLGKDGDSYIDLNTWNYYLKTEEIWIYNGNISYKGKYTVNFYCGDEIIKTLEVEPYSRIYSPQPKELDGYVFAYWYARGYEDRPWNFDGYFADRVFENIDLYAKYNRIKTTYTLDALNGGNVSPNTIDLAYGEPYELPIPSTNRNMDGRDLIFDRWYIGDTSIPTKGDSWTYADLGTTLTASYTLSDGDLRHFYTFEENDSGGYILRRCINSCRDMLVPSCYNGKPITSIGDDAFYDLSNINSIELSRNLVSIGTNAFGHCVSLKSINIPNTITSIGGRVFRECLELEAIYIPDSVLIMGEDIFAGCPKTVFYCGSATKPVGWRSTWNSMDRPVYWEISSLNLHNEDFYYGVKNDEILIIKFVSSLNHFEIPNEIDNKVITTICSEAFKENEILNTIKIPDTVKKIDGSAFRDCRNLNTLTLPCGLTSIGESAFFNCESLQNVAIPSGVNSIDIYAFSGCTSITSIIIPRSVTTLGVCIFTRCDNLNTIYCEADSKPVGWDEDWNAYCPASIVWSYTN